uniref:Uncharacterized protein n=1 Tax=Romanomermis culicivorax TaxID=13658 RepID=A0A915L614_ROMCU
MEISAMLNNFPGDTRAVPQLADVWVGLTIPTKARQEWKGSEPILWKNREAHGMATPVLKGFIGSTESVPPQANVRMSV